MVLMERRSLPARRLLLALAVLGAASPLFLTARVGSVDEKKGADSTTVSIDDKYVRENLQDFLQPTSLSFGADGRARMKFDFSKKNSDHEEIFKPPIRTDLNSPIRWTVRREDVRLGSRSDGKYYKGGVRIADRGMSLLDCWFKDDVEVEIVYMSVTSSDANHVAAPVFCNAKGEALGSNFGTQCVVFKRGRPTSKRKGKPKTMTVYSHNRFGLTVKDGTFEAKLKGRPKESMTYKAKKFASGRVGLVWGGKVSGMVPTLEITGRIDSKKMAKMMRKRRK